MLSIIDPNHDFVSHFRISNAGVSDADNYSECIAFDISVSDFLYLCHLLNEARVDLYMADFMAVETPFGTMSNEVYLINDSEEEIEVSIFTPNKKDVDNITEFFRVVICEDDNLVLPTYAESEDEFLASHEKIVAGIKKYFIDNKFSSELVLETSFDFLCDEDEDEDKCAGCNCSNCEDKSECVDCECCNRDKDEN